MMQSRTPATGASPTCVAEGGVIIIHEEDGRLVVESADDAVRRAQAIVRRHAPHAAGVVDELLAERRAEAERG